MCYVNGLPPLGARTFGSREEQGMERSSHNFFKEYKGPIAFGLSREVDEASFKVFLQKFSSDQILEVLCPRLAQEELDGIVEMLTQVMRKHLTDREYHTLFLDQA